LPEVVQHGVTGFLHPVGDVDALTRSAVRLLSNDAEWRTFSAAAAADARTRFSESAIVAQYEALYERTLAARELPAHMQTPVSVSAFDTSIGLP